MPTVTPRGSRRTMLVNPRSYSPVDLPSWTRAAPAKNRMLSVMKGMSAAETEIGLPTSSASSLAMLSASASIASASFNIIAERSLGGVSNHTSSYALRAAATALSASSRVPICTVPTDSPFAGLMSGSVSPLDESTQSPPTNIFHVVPSPMFPLLKVERTPAPEPTIRPPVWRVQPRSDHSPRRPSSGSALDGAYNGRTSTDRCQPSVWAACRTRARSASQNSIRSKLLDRSRPLSSSTLRIRYRSVCRCT